jgi:hypothetical protein
MWILTFGVYSIYWFYRNWLYVKQRDQSSIMPVARVIFLLFWYYPLYADLRRDSTLRFGRQHLPAPAAGVLLAAAFFVSQVIGSKTDYALLSTLAGLIFALPLANYINFANRDHAPALTHNSTWSLRHYALVLLCTPLLLFVGGSESGILPGDSVIPGSKLPDHNLKFLQRNDVVRPGDAIQYFYSDAFINIRDDGNGFSDRHVFSYWMDEDRFVLESATYDEIRDIKINWGRRYTLTTLEVIRDDGSSFTVYASTNEKQDKLFVNSLLERWKRARPPEIPDSMTEPQQ